MAISEVTIISVWTHLTCHVMLWLHNSRHTCTPCTQYVRKKHMKIYWQLSYWNIHVHTYMNKKAQLTLTNPRDAKPCQKLLRFDMLTMLSLKILVYLHSF